MSVSRRKMVGGHGADAGELFIGRSLGAARAF